MNIHVPRNFTLKTAKGYANVRNRQLFVHNIDMEVVMYEVTYQLKGRNKCFYCGRTLNDRNRTLDHMYPRHWGGITIPENLCPCCKKCNNEKGDMTLIQYKKWKTLPIGERLEFYSKCTSDNERVFNSGKILGNDTWIEYVSVAGLKKKFPLDRLKKFSDYNNPKQGEVIYLSNDGKWIAKGMKLLHYAIRKNKKEVPVVMLENVYYKH